MIEPVIRWMGGKRKLSSFIKSKFPENFGTYYEPFLGGAAIALSLPPSQKKILGDINQDLMCFYRVLAKDPDEIYSRLMKIKQVDQELYLKVRSLDRLPDWRDRLSEADQAARFFFLNQSCFNGVWRENKLGQNNTPFGRCIDFIPMFGNMEKVSQFFAHPKCELRWESYSSTCRDAIAGDLIYLDPPYSVLEGKEKVTYTSVPFSQADLKTEVDFWTTQGCYVVLSNACTPEVLELYKDYKIEYLEASRCVAGNGDRRPAKEVLINNFHKIG